MEDDVDVNDRDDGVENNFDAADVVDGIDVDGRDDVENNLGEILDEVDGEEVENNLGGIVDDVDGEEVENNFDGDIDVLGDVMDDKEDDVNIMDGVDVDDENNFDGDVDENLERILSSSDGSIGLMCEGIGHEGGCGINLRFLSFSPIFNFLD